jgi:hypothetical protein
MKETVNLFLLCKDDVAREDGTFTINFPKRMLKLDDEYKPVDIGITEKRKLKESRHLYVFSTRPDINRLFSEKGGINLAPQAKICCGAQFSTTSGCRAGLPAAMGPVARLVP